MIKRIKGRKSSKRSIRAARPAAKRGSAARRRKTARRPVLNEPSEVFTL